MPTASPKIGLWRLRLLGQSRAVTLSSASGRWTTQRHLASL